ncbi:MAG: hypothetical protein EWV84_22950 [Microcystis sp. M_QC_C_20170808_M3Col]|nr:MAG: hypothetical protein EWV84_22950 [Microcystis sp. M_QC_C_20170808_M3Col]
MGFWGFSSISPSPHFPISPLPHLPTSPSPHFPISPLPHLPTSPLNITNHGNARKPENGFFRFDGQ